jgi:cytochrome oxidase Cu insertion factor (SCO1/SenC/PrrC family)
MLSYLNEKFKSYRELYRILNQMQKVKRGEMSGEEFLKFFAERYFQVDWELCEKITEILASEEIWKDGKTSYKTKIPLEGKVVDVEIDRNAGFVVVDKNGEKRVKFKLEYSVRC